MSDLNFSLIIILIGCWLQHRKKRSRNIGAEKIHLITLSSNFIAGHRPSRQLALLSVYICEQFKCMASCEKKLFFMMILCFGMSEREKSDAELGNLFVSSQSVDVEICCCMMGTTCTGKIRRAI